MLYHHLMQAIGNSVLSPACQQQPATMVEGAMLVLGDFNASDGTDWACYKLCVDPQASGTRNDNGTRLLDFHNLKIENCRFLVYERPEMHCWIWHSNAGGIVKGSDHILIDTHWRILRNHKVFQSTQPFPTDHRLVATLSCTFSQEELQKVNILCVRG